jgi:acyl-CoA reductase-like NAD-dependent aldehyde dehydrogenase
VTADRSRRIAGLGGDRGRGTLAAAAPAGRLGRAARRAAGHHRHDGHRADDLRDADPATRLGCLVSARQGERVLDYIESGKREASLVTGGGRAEVVGSEHGWFIEPTVFETDNSTRIAKEEIFGPVLSVIRGKDYDAMLEQANGVEYGLAAGLYTTNLRNAMRAADRLRAGSVWVNQYFNLVDGSPFGGYRGSGLGREYCKETLDMYTQLKSIVLAEELPPPLFG